MVYMYIIKKTTIFLVYVH